MAKKTQAGTWLDGAVEVPLATSPANKDRTKRQKFYRRFIMASIVILPISLVGNLILGAQAARQQPAVVQEQQYSAQGKAAAILDVQQWLAQTPSPLPSGGSLVAWDSGARVAKPKLTEHQKQATPLPSYDIELHDLTVVDGLGQTYTAEVQVAVGDKVGAFALGDPSLLPVGNPDASNVHQNSPWMGVSPSQAPKPVETSIKTWLAAFTSSDPDALRVAVGDGNGKHTYVPLYNVKSASSSILNAAYLPDGSQSADQTITKSNTMIVQVSIAVQWQGNDAPAAGTSVPTIVYDLLVHKAESAAPVVVAWGGPGTGTTLKAFQNALGRSVIAPGKQTTGSAAKPSATPTPDPTSTAGHGGTDGADGATSAGTSGTTDQNAQG